MLLLAVLLIASFTLSCGYFDVKSSSTYSFGIDYENNTFLLDGYSFRYISGSVHYFRIHPDQWNDRLKRVRAAGFNAIQSYIPWNFHELYKGRYDFSGPRNLTRFMQLAAKNDLYILLRIGPFVCGEWESGGLPWWLPAEYEDIKMRTSDPRYLFEIKRWFNIILPMIVPFLRKNGGPVLMLQIENEYGSFPICDKFYMLWLRELVKSHVGDDVLLYTTDGPGEGYLKCGAVAEVYPTVDFGPASDSRVDGYFAAQKKFAPKGPLVNSEFYPGWFLMWGQRSQSLPSIKQIVDTAGHMYGSNASFNFYMFHGGTNFGFWNGADRSAPVTTSYDYSAPISEAGDITQKYLEIRNWIKSIPDWPSPPSDIPKDNPKMKYGPVKMKRIGAVCDRRLRGILTGPNRCIESKHPISFEKLKHPNGFVVYQTILKFGGTNLSVPLLRDRGYVVLDKQLQGILVNQFGNYSNRWVILKGAVAGKTLFILVENTGRLIDVTINDFKGILSNVSLDGNLVGDWTQCGIQLEPLLRKMEKSTVRKWYEHKARIEQKRNFVSSPSVYVGSFLAERREDTFFDPSGWGKGVLFVNGHNLGRYWPLVGPQVTLYVPRPVLKRNNLIIILELENAGNCISGSCTVNFIDHPIFNFTNNAFGIEASRRHK